MATAMTSPLPAAAPRDHQDILLSFLRNPSPDSDERWRRWCTGLVRNDALSSADLLQWWNAIVDFDPVLQQHSAHPVAVPDGTAIVAGSGKEAFKTFNVSTAAAILAAAAGTPVIKGISRSVSAVSGAADILDDLGIPAVTRASAIAPAMERHNIAFVSYPVFCPHYAARYDGVFAAINPASFFMPVATLCVRASAFVLGLAHANVALSARALGAIRPDLTTGTVVSTELAAGETVDEYSDVGTVRLARLDAGVVTNTIKTNPPPSRRWRTSVAHRATHRGNAAIVADALAPGLNTPARHLVELNAALIISASAPACSPEEALHRAYQTRRSGRAQRLLQTLANDG